MKSTKKGPKIPAKGSHAHLSLISSKSPNTETLICSKSPHCDPLQGSKAINTKREHSSSNETSPIAPIKFSRRHQNPNLSLAIPLQTPKRAGKQSMGSPAIFSPKYIDVIASRAQEKDESNMNSPSRATNLNSPSKARMNINSPSKEINNLKSPSKVIINMDSPSKANASNTFKSIIKINPLYEKVTPVLPFVAGNDQIEETKVLVKRLHVPLMQEEFNPYPDLTTDMYSLECCHL